MAIVAHKNIDKIRWWHRVPLGNGEYTPGKIDIESLEAAYLFDQLIFTGKSVLDIGAFDGYHSFTAEKRGASRVVALDNPNTRVDKRAFDFLHNHFQSSVEWRWDDIFDLGGERFDIVLCYGVMYHINDPLTAAINCFQSANERVVFEGQIFEAEAPVLLLLEPGAINGDKTNLYCMSTAYITAIANQNGFELEHKIISPSNPPRVDRNRGALMFKRVREATPEYHPRCFSKPPVAIKNVPSWGELDPKI